MNFAWHTRFITHVFDIGWGNEPILNYLINGKFSWRPTGSLWPVEYTFPDGGQPPFDFVGLNYYSRCGGMLLRIAGKLLMRGRSPSPACCTCVYGRPPRGARRRCPKGSGRHARRPHSVFSGACIDAQDRLGP